MRVTSFSVGKMPVDSMSYNKIHQSGRGAEPMQYTYLEGLLQLSSVLRTSGLANLDELHNSIATPPRALVGSLIVPQNLLRSLIQHRALTPPVVCIANIIAQRACKTRNNGLMVPCEVVQLDRFVDMLFALGLSRRP